MTEYDYSPAAHDQYMATQHRIGSWANNSQHYAPTDPYAVHPSHEGEYIHDRAAHYDSWGDGEHRGRSRYRERPRNLGRESRVDPPPSPVDDDSDSDHPSYDHQHDPNFPPPSDFGGAPRDYQFDPSYPGTQFMHSGYGAPRSHLPGMEGAFSPAHQNMAVSPYHPNPGASQAYPTSNRFSHSHLPLSGQHMDPYYGHRSRSPTYSDSSYTRSRSYSRSLSYDSRDSRDPGYHRYGNGNHGSVRYQTIHPSQGTPTIIQPSRKHPIVVPLNGGAGGYVVVPAQGNSLRVLDTQGTSGGYGYKKPSFIDRMLSPTKWGSGGNGRSRRRSRRRL